MSQLVEGGGDTHVIRRSESAFVGESVLDTSTAGQSVMMICPNLKCRKVLSVPAQYRGKHVKCQFCGLTLAVPAGKSGAPEQGEAVDKGKKKK